ncbi:MAG: tetratricopeptide repeat protein [Anaerolineae bacterium]
MKRRLMILGVVAVVVLFGALAAVLTFTGQEADAPASATTTELDDIKAQIDAGDYEGAVTELEALLESDPSNAEAHFQLALVYFNLQQFDLAREHFNRSVELEPDRAGAVHHNLGVLAYQIGDLDTALVEFNAALEVDPDDPDTYYQRGATYLVQALPMGATEPDMSFLEKAEGDFNRALEIAPRKPEALVGLANAEMLRGNLDAAAEQLEDAIEQKPDMREALFALGQVYVQLGRNDEAKETLEHFLETDPPNVWAAQARSLLEQLN